MTITRALPMVYVLVLYVLVYRWLLCCQNKMNICLYKNQKSGQANVLKQSANWYSANFLGSFLYCKAANCLGVSSPLTANHQICMKPVGNTAKEELSYILGEFAEVLSPQKSGSANHIFANHKKGVGPQIAMLQIAT